LPPGARPALFRLMKKLLTPLLLLLGSVLFLGGCGTYDNQLVVVGLRLELAGITRAADGSVAVTWQLVNPNIAPYLMARIGQTVSLNGTVVGTTLDTDPMAFTAQSTTNKTSKLSLAGPAAERVLADAIAKGSAAYHVDAQVVIQLYGDSVEHSVISGSGSVPVTGK